MTQYDLIGEICANALLSRRDCTYLMNIVRRHFRVIANQVPPAPGQSNKLNMKNFGSFRRDTLAARAFTPPNQSGTYTAPTHITVRFRPSLYMREIADGATPPP